MDSPGRATKPACELRLMIRPYGFGHHDPCHGLAHEKRALHVDVEGEVEVGFGRVDGRVGRAEPGIVDEDVDATELGHRLRRPRGDLVQVEHVHLEPDGSAAHLDGSR